MVSEVSGPELRQNAKAKGHGREKQLRTLPSGSRERTLLMRDKM